MKLKKLVGVLALSALVIPGLSLATSLQGHLSAGRIELSSQETPPVAGDLTVPGGSIDFFAVGGLSQTLFYEPLSSETAEFFTELASDSDSDDLTLMDSKKNHVYMVMTPDDNFIGLASPTENLRTVELPISKDIWVAFTDETGAFSSGAISGQLRVIAPDGSTVPYSKFVQNAKVPKQWVRGYTVQVPIDNFDELAKKPRSSKSKVARPYDAP